jgi:hypothetical protein
LLLLRPVALNLLLLQLSLVLLPGEVIPLSEVRDDSELLEVSEPVDCDCELEDPLDPKAPGESEPEPVEPDCAMAETDNAPAAAQINPN